jgi:hypothetical protein
VYDKREKNESYSTKKSGSVESLHASIFFTSDFEASNSSLLGNFLMAFRNSTIELVSSCKTDAKTSVLL